MTIDPPMEELEANAGRKSHKCGCRDPWESDQGMIWPAGLAGLMQRVLLATHSSKWNKGLLGEYLNKKSSHMKNWQDVIYVWVQKFYHWDVLDPVFTVSEKLAYLLETLCSPTFNLLFALFNPPFVFSSLSLQGSLYAQTYFGSDFWIDCSCFNWRRVCSAWQVSLPILGKCKVYQHTARNVWFYFELVSNLKACVPMSSSRCCLVSSPPSVIHCGQGFYVPPPLTSTATPPPAYFNSNTHHPSHPESGQIVLFVCVLFLPFALWRQWWRRWSMMGRWWGMKS